MVVEPRLVVADCPVGETTEVKSKLNVPTFVVADKPVNCATASFALP